MIRDSDLGQHAVDTLKARHLDQPARSYRPGLNECKLCPFTTKSVTAAFVHARVEHGLRGQ